MQLKLMVMDEYGLTTHKSADICVLLIKQNCVDRSWRPLSRFLNTYWPVYHQVSTYLWVTTQWLQGRGRVRRRH